VRARALVSPLVPTRPQYEAALAALDREAAAASYSERDGDGSGNGNGNGNGVGRVVETRGTQTDPEVPFEAAMAQLKQENIALFEKGRALQAQCVTSSSSMSSSSMTTSCIS
jgi:hypothetical protein